MPNVFELSPSARAKCRGCEGKIDKGVLRFGERLPNPFADDGGEMTQWFHLDCGAYRRPEAFLAAIEASPDAITDPAERERLTREAQLGIDHRRATRLSKADRAPTGRATCRACKNAIDKDGWRIALLFYDDGRFVPSGFAHASCVPTYCETTAPDALMPRIRHFSPQITDEDASDILKEFRS
jgi:hypothetical protein